MLTFQQAQQALTELADELPEAIFKGLNGGIVLLPDTKLHPKHLRGDLYILGQYHNAPRGLGRYITIYYGSFRRVHGHLTDEEQREKLRETLHHELTHHLEHQAGDKSLEVQDAKDIADYRQQISPKKEGGKSG